MRQILKQTVTTAEQNKIKNDGLVGAEQQPNMYALAVSNMILRGDGKANLYQGSCFDRGITDAMKKHKCNVGMLNPPYSQTDEAFHELNFVKHMLDCLVPGGVGFALIPLPKAIAPHQAKEELLRYHTLDAVMSLPNEIFYPLDRIPCIMAFRAHVPHGQSKKKTWFAYWKEDGFVKTKHLGRIDKENKWPSIRDRWIEQFRNQEDVPNLTIKQYVNSGDEWCAEAYMETDYDSITKREIENMLRRHFMFKVMLRVHFEEQLSEEV